MHQAQRQVRPCYHRRRFPRRFLRVNQRNLPQVAAAALGAAASKSHTTGMYNVARDRLVLVR